MDYQHEAPTSPWCDFACEDVPDGFYPPPPPPTAREQKWIDAKEADEEEFPESFFDFQKYANDTNNHRHDNLLTAHILYTGTGDDCLGEPGIVNNAVADKKADVEIIFRNHAARLIAEIQKYDLVAGAIAWLTNVDILQAMSELNTVSIVVQKEDFLRPDINSSNDLLQHWYNKLHGLQEWGYPFPHLSDISYGGTQNFDAIRCVGMCPKNKDKIIPRMHNKFLVFGRINKITDNSHIGSLDSYDITWDKVWTGSYNLSGNAERSFENAVLISSKKIAASYLREWGTLMHISEPLDWKSRWIRPQYRLGS